MPSLEEVVVIEVRHGFGSVPQRGCRGGPRRGGGPGAEGGLQQRKGPRHRLAGVILGEHGDGLGHGHGLGGAGLAALLPLRVEVVASGLQVLQKLHILGALPPGLLQVLFGVGERLAVAGVLDLHLVQFFLAGIDLVGLGRGEVLEVFHCLRLIALDGLELCLEVLEQLAHDAEDAAGLRGVGGRLLRLDLQEDPRCRPAARVRRPGHDLGRELHGQLVGDLAAVAGVQGAEQGRDHRALSSGGSTLGRGLEGQEGHGTRTSTLALGTPGDQDLVLGRRIPQ
mmetsp:Transcript_46713/g.118396  ORF Transcript_46713/g.118396 Transcript_46713/m.118396 type:complete len:282 (-) Transcript_46713:625-1470(-)